MNKELEGMINAEGADSIADLVDDFGKLDDDDKDELSRIANKYPTAFWWFTDQASCVERFDKGMRTEFFDWNTEIFIRIIQEVEKIKT